MSDGQRRGRSLLPGVLLLLALVVLGPIVASSYGAGQAASERPEAFEEAMAEGRAHTVSPHPNSTTAIWPYTSRSRSVEGATLPINVVVLADAELVRTTLIHRPDAQWEDQRHGLNGTAGRSNASDDGDARTPEETPGTPEVAVDGNGSTPDPNATPTSNATLATPNASPAGDESVAGNESPPTPNGITSTPNGTLTPGGTTPPPDASAVRGTPTPNVTTSAPADGDGNLLFPTGVNSTGVYWSEASGSNRYTYVTGGERGSGRWIDEADQLHDGDYFGTRHHIRFYEVRDGENTWTALQVHREHFDWFRLRHTVGSLPRAQHYVESQFYDQWYIADLHRERFTRGGILNSDGWVTVVDVRYHEVLRESVGVMTILAGLVVGSVIGGFTPSIERRDVREAVEAVPVDLRFVVMAAAVAALPLFVRLGSLAVERAEVVNSPKVVAGAFYPVLAVGLPVCAYVLARGLEPRRAFTAAVGGLGVGILLDYAFLGITVLPIQLIVHRAFLLVALGVVAIAGTDRSPGTGVDARDPTLLAGVGLWVAGLLWTLFFW